MSSASNELVLLPIADGPLCAPDDAITVVGVVDRALTLGSNATHFGMLVSGQLRLVGDSFDARLRGPSYFVSASPIELRPDGARCLIVTVRGYSGVSQLGAPLETSGRLRYIDGCTDTLLVCPPRVGEPCLNHLHIPPRTHQSAHLHPSLRLGVIAGGRGRCIAPDGERALETGLGFLIPAGVVHNFATEDAPLDVLAWHPDSDFGPTDEDHPMINRTYVR